MAERVIKEAEYYVIPALIAFFLGWGIAYKGAKTAADLASAGPGSDVRLYILMAIVGVAMIIAGGVYMYLFNDGLAVKVVRLCRFGWSTLFLDGEPAPGGKLEGRLRAKLDMTVEEPVCLTLALARILYQYNRLQDRQQRVKHILWQEDRDIMPDQWQRVSGRRVEVPFCLEVPSCVQTDDDYLVPDAHWELMASREMSGPDFRATFRIPMAVPKLASPESE